MNNQWAQFMQNPKGIALKKFMVQVIPERAGLYEELFTRLSAALVTDNDMKLFGEMINDVMSAGYKKAVEDYRTQINKLGYEVSLITKD